MTAIRVDRYIPLVNLVHLFSQLLRQRLDAVNDHSVAISNAIRNRYLAKRVSGFIALAGQARNDTYGSVMLVQRCRQLFSRPRQLLLEVIRLESQCIPFVLERCQQRRYRRQRRRSRAHDARGLDGKQVVGQEGLAGAGLGAVLIDVLLYESLFVHDACLPC